MTKEIMQTRLTDLERHLQQTQANYNMILGGIEECKFWLAEFDKAPVEEDLK